ncbi:MAG: TRAP transporter large permease [Oscillospiraceae bacterium]|nr:TRAP transporter large permease [Oscillospiraceae bacterium]
MVGMLIGVFVVLLIVLFLGTPISLGIGFLGVAGITLILNKPVLLDQICTTAYNQCTSPTTIMIPLFIIMAEFLANSNIAGDLYDVIARRLKKLPCNLGIASVISSAIFAAVCGSAPATAATLGRISIPAMQKRGYDLSFAAGTQAAGGNLGILIPPSVNLIIFGLVTETNVVSLFMAGVGPGILIAIMMIAYMLIRNKVDKKMIVPPPAAAVEEENKKYSVKFDLITVLPMVILILLIFGTLYSGICTATESAAIGAICAVVIVLIQKRMTKECLKKSFLGAASNSCMIWFLMFGGLVFAQFLTVQGLPQALSTTIIEADPNKWVLFIVVMIIFLVLGCFMEPLSIMYIVLPFTYPFLTQMGFDPLWLGAVITINCAIGMITPPVGMNLFVMKGAVGIPMGTIIKGVIPYIVIFALAILLCCFFPGICTWLPGTMA